MGCGLNVVMHTVTNDIHRVKGVYGRDSLAYIDLNTLAERRFRSFSPGSGSRVELDVCGPASGLTLVASDCRRRLNTHQQA